MSASPQGANTNPKIPFDAQCTDLTGHGLFDFDLIILWNASMVVPQVLTRDSVTVTVDAVVYYRVSNPTMVTKFIRIL